MRSDKNNSVARWVEKQPPGSVFSACDLPPDAMVSIETVKNSKDNLDDFKKDVEWLRSKERSSK